MMRVEVRPELLHWARERAGYSLASLHKRFPQIDAWERGEAMPTLKQLEAFAKAAFVPIGYLFLAEPPEERVPIPDLRTMGSEPLGPPSPDLLDILYLCQRRQAWYRDYAKLIGEEPRPFVGSARIEDTVEQTADAMRRALNFYLTQGARLSKRFVRTLVVSTLEGQTSFTEAFRLLGVKKMATFRELGVSLGVGA